jgi:tetratricopeptide (TPR) repeat protein
LAEDLGRFLEGQPVRARPVGAVERAVKWARRRPAAALLVAALLVMAGAAAGTGIWLQHQEAVRRAAQEQRQGQAREAARTALGRADDLRREERWKEALVVLADASPQLVEANSPDLEDRLQRSQTEFRIADELEGAREGTPLQSDGPVDYSRWAAEYRTALEHAGVRVGVDAETVAGYVRASAIRDQLVAAVEDYAFVAFMLGDGPLVERLLVIARSADPGSPWRDRFRDPAVWRSVPQLQELAAAAFTSSPPPSDHQLGLLGLLLEKAGYWGDCTRLLGEACRRQPRNFWVHREMGFALLVQARYLEAAGHYRVAQALRPANPAVGERLGWSLYHVGQTDEAIAAYRQALRLDPTSSLIRGRLVVALAEGGYWREAEGESRRGLDGDPASPLPAHLLGQAQFAQGRFEEAARTFRAVTEVAPDFAEAHFYLGLALAEMARHEDAVTAFRKVTGLKEARLPVDRVLARELAAAGRPEEALTVLQTAAAREPRNPWFHLESGKLLRSRGKSEEAAAAFRKAALDPHFSPAWEGLAAAQLDRGRFAEARDAAGSLLALPAKEEERRARQRLLDLCDALLAVEADLPAILAGKERPEKVAARRAVAEWCLKYKRLPATAAGLYEAALTARPSLADDLEAGVRVQAACAAALAGCGAGADAEKLDDRRRAGLRKQALDWLTAEYDARAERHRAGKPGDRTVVATAVRSWQHDEDLAGVRDEQALARLPADERQAWQGLWARVATLGGRDPAAQLAEARAHVARQEWGPAAGCYAERMELEPTDDGDVWFEYAAAQLLAGDRPGYRRTCAAMLARCQPKGPLRHSLVARACTLAPGSTDDPNEPFRLTAPELVRSEREFWAQTEQAALAVRGGFPEDALRHAERSLVADGRPGRAVLSWLWLALAYHKMGNPDEARRWLDRADNWLDQQGGRMPRENPSMGSDLHNWLEAQVLRREADPLLR